MAVAVSVLDWVEERHEGPEPRVVLEDVQALLREVIRPDDPDSGRSVALVAQRAGVSTRTVYRCLAKRKAGDPDVRSIQLDLADRLALAVDSHLAHCRLVWPDGKIESY